VTIEETIVAPTDERPNYVKGRLLRNDVYELVLDRILSGRFAPGQRLRDSDLTSWLQVSRTPVREAVSRLAAIGLVTTSPNRFTVVAPLDRHEVADAVAVLRLLYPAVLRSAEIELETEVELTLLAARLERGDLDPFDGYRRAMTAVAGAPANRVLGEAVQVADLRVARYLRLAPEAAAVLDRERVIALARSLCAEPAGAVGAVDELLADLAGVLAAPAAS
jgi:DNA-binding GntR family transcriptional regulator